MSKKTVTRQHVTKSGDTWEYEETEEMRKAVERLHQTMRKNAQANKPVK